MSLTINNTAVLQLADETSSFTENAALRLRNPKGWLNVCVDATLGITGGVLISYVIFSITGVVVAPWWSIMLFLLIVTTGFGWIWFDQVVFTRDEIAEGKRRDAFATPKHYSFEILRELISNEDDASWEEAKSLLQDIRLKEADKRIMSAADTLQGLRITTRHKKQVIEIIETSEIGKRKATPSYFEHLREMAEALLRTRMIRALEQVTLTKQYLNNEADDQIEEIIELLEGISD